MAGNGRLNKVIELLEQGQAVFSCGTIPNGNFEEIAALGQYKPDYPRDRTRWLRLPHSAALLQCLLQPQTPRRQGQFTAGCGAARAPPYTRERNAWVIKQTRCRAVWARAAASRQRRGCRGRSAGGALSAGAWCPDFERGERGWASALAPTYWGLAPQDYCEAADVWPLDPDGELLLMGIVENVRGIDTLPDILRQVKGIGAIWAGPGICRCPWGCGARQYRTWRQPFSRSLRSASMPACPVRPAHAGRRCGNSIGTGFPHRDDSPTRSLDGLQRGRQAAGRLA